MLVSLHVKNLALIQETEVFFGPGLNILTGETGAGKSIIIGSVGLALGGRADRGHDPDRRGLRPCGAGVRAGEKGAGGQGARP